MDLLYVYYVASVHGKSSGILVSDKEGKIVYRGEKLPQDYSYIIRRKDPSPGIEYAFLTESAATETVHGHLVKIIGIKEITKESLLRDYSLGSKSIDSFTNSA